MQLVAQLDALDHVTQLGVGFDQLSRRLSVVVATSHSWQRHHERLGQVLQVVRWAGGQVVDRRGAGQLVQPWVVRRLQRTFVAFDQLVEKFGLATAIAAHVALPAHLLQGVLNLTVVFQRRQEVGIGAALQGERAEHVHFTSHTAALHLGLAGAAFGQSLKVQLADDGLQLGSGLVTAVDLGVSLGAHGRQGLEHGLAAVQGIHIAFALEVVHRVERALGFQLLAQVARLGSRVGEAHMVVVAVGLKFLDQLGVPGLFGSDVLGGLGHNHVVTSTLDGCVRDAFADGEQGLEALEGVGLLVGQASLSSGVASSLSSSDQGIVFGSRGVEHGLLLAGQGLVAVLKHGAHQVLRLGAQVVEANLHLRVSLAGGRVVAPLAFTSGVEDELVDAAGARATIGFRDQGVQVSDAFHITFHLTSLGGARSEQVTKLLGGLHAGIRCSVDQVAGKHHIVQCLAAHALDS